MPASTSTTSASSQPQVARASLRRAARLLAAARTQRHRNARLIGRLRSGLDA